MKTFCKLERIILISYYVTITSLSCCSGPIYLKQTIQEKTQILWALPTLSKQSTVGKMRNKPDLEIRGRLGPHC